MRKEEYCQHEVPRSLGDHVRWNNIGSRLLNILNPARRETEIIVTYGKGFVGEGERARFSIGDTFTIRFESGAFRVEYTGKGEMTFNVLSGSELDKEDNREG